MKKTETGKKTPRKRVFQDPFLLTDTFIPKRIQHRDKEIRDITYHLSSLIRYGLLANNILVYGSPGTGKTHSVKRVLSNLKGEINALYGRAYRGSSCHAFFRTFLERNFDVSLHPRESISVYYSAFEKALGQKRNILLVFDDIQYLLLEDPKGFDGLLFYLSRLDKNLGLILIGNIRVNDLSLALGPPTTSSLRLRSVYFPKYDAIELKDILIDRAREALTENAFKKSSTALGKIAALTAQGWGSARYALDLLKEAGMVSEAILGKAYITEEAVSLAERMLEVGKIEEEVRNLPHQPMAVLEAVYRQKSKMDLSTGDVYSAYERVCRERGVEAFSLRRVSDIITELDSAGLIASRVVSRGSLGRTRLISWPSNPALERVYSCEREEGLWGGSLKS
jgi:cell division control protein 6